MYTDTHLHFSMVQERCATSGGEILEEMARRGAFLLDVGTKSGDICARREAVGKALASVDNQWREKAAERVYYSAGIWPSAEAIENREQCLAQLEKDVEHIGVIAIGECGLDHHWNPTGEDRRSEADFNKDMIAGERELFERQLDMAKRLNMPVIVHSRDAFKGTIDAIRNVGYDKGIIHCFSYGLKEVKAFLERGWYIAFGGGITYTKNSKIAALKEVIRAVPDEAIMVETDAPFLSPEPMRGKPNTPLYIEYTYKFLADIRGVSVESLCRNVDDNVARLFCI